MKILLSILIIFLFVALPTHAETNNWKEACGSIEKIAEAMMDGRQRGVSMSKMMEIFCQKKDSPKIYEILLIEAYDSPRYSTKKMQKESIEDFSNKAYLDCVKSLRKE